MNAREGSRKRSLNDREPPGAWRLRGCLVGRDRSLPARDPVMAEALETAFEVGCPFRIRALVERAGLDDRTVGRALRTAGGLHPWGAATVMTTGFGPFGEVTENPSSAFADGLAAALRRLGREATSAHLPVTDGVASSMSEDASSPSVVRVHCGVATTRAEICVEWCAHNHRGAVPGVDGRAPAGALRPGGPFALRTWLPVPTLVEAWNAAGRGDQPRARVSFDPGDYICNATYWHSLLAVRRARWLGVPAEALFVHIPAADMGTAEGWGARFAVALDDVLRSWPPEA